MPNLCSTIVDLTFVDNSPEKKKPGNSNPVLDSAGLTVYPSDVLAGSTLYAENTLFSYMYIQNNSSF